MIDVINISVNNDHFVRCSKDTIARSGEADTTSLVIELPEKLVSYWPYLDFKMPNGEKYKTERLEVVEGKVNYDVPLYVLQYNGELELQIVLQNAKGKIWKSNVKKFNVRYSVNAADDIPNKEDFITKAQNLLDEMSKYGGSSDLPLVSTEDNNKIAMVVGGKWCAVTIPFAEEESV